MKFVTKEEINAVVKPLVDGIETLNKSMGLIAQTVGKLELKVLDLEKQLAESKKAKPVKEPTPPKAKTIEVDTGGISVSCEYNIDGIIGFLESERQSLGPDSNILFLRKYFNDSLDRLRVLQSKIEFAKRGGTEEVGRTAEELNKKWVQRMEDARPTKPKEGSIFVKYEDDPGTALPSSDELNKQWVMHEGRTVIELDAIRKVIRDGVAFETFVRLFGVKGVLI